MSPLRYMSSTKKTKGQIISKYLKSLLEEMYLVTPHNYILFCSLCYVLMCSHRLKSPADG